MSQNHTRNYFMQRLTCANRKYSFDLRSRVHTCTKSLPGIDLLVTTRALSSDRMKPCLLNPRAIFMNAEGYYDLIRSNEVESQQFTIAEAAYQGLPFGPPFYLWKNDQSVTDHVLSYTTTHGENAKNFMPELFRLGENGRGILTIIGLINNDIREKAPQAAPRKFYRFNEDGFIKVPFDDWEPRQGSNSGSKTLRKIKVAFDSWISAPQIIEELRDCARKLVERRRTRMISNPSRWERFATGVEFQTAHSSPLFYDREVFRNHLKSEYYYTGGDELERVIEQSMSYWRPPKHLLRMSYRLAVGSGRVAKTTRRVGYLHSG